MLLVIPHKVKPTIVKFHFKYTVGRKIIVNRQGDSQKSKERGKGRSLSSLTMLFGFFKPYKLNLMLASLVLIATAGISLSFPIAVRRVVDGFYIGSSQLMDS